jgi:hypothetical protein
VNYKEHNDLSWFRPLLGDNSPTSSGLIWKMNRCYKGVSREFEKFTWRRGKWISYPCLKGRGPFIGRAVDGLLHTSYFYIWEYITRPVGPQTKKVDS